VPWRIDARPSKIWSFNRFGWQVKKGHPILLGSSKWKFCFNQIIWTWFFIKIYFSAWGKNFHCCLQPNLHSFTENCRLCSTATTWLRIGNGRLAMWQSERPRKSWHVILCILMMQLDIQQQYSPAKSAKSPPFYYSTCSLKRLF